MIGKKKVFLVACKDYNFYNFRSELILELLKIGFDVTIVCPPGDKIQFFIERGCHFIGHMMDRRGTNPFKDLSLIKTYYKIFKTGKPDIVLSYTTKSVLYSGIACRLLQIPYIVNNAGLLEPSNYNPIVGICLKILYKLGFRDASCMMYQNSRERDVLNELLKNKINYRDIPGSGVNLNSFAYVDYPDETIPIIFNYVGRLQKKGIVEYAGSVMDMKPCIAGAHAVIHASYYEGMTNVVLEHSAMGRVCIGSDIPGVREAINNGKTGFLFPVKDKQALIKVVERFINLPYSEKVIMGKAARKKMEREFDRNIVTNIYLEEIDKIFSNK